MMRALITGVSGFVGRYLAAHLLSEKIEVWGTTRADSPDLYIDNRVQFIKVDLNDEQEIMSWIERIRPDHIYHLAGQSSVKLSWENKIETFDANVNKTIHLLEAVTKSSIAENVRVLTVGSSEEYGKVDNHEVPIKEETPLRPISPYGISKATVSMLAKHYYNAYGLQIIHARPFNHIGPGQGLGFVTSDFAKQVAVIEAGLSSNSIRVGNMTAQRDFLDVMDIVRAYFELIRLGQPGQIYNICSGKPIEISYILDFYLRHTVKLVEVDQDPTLMRPSDVPIYYGSLNKLENETGWKASISLDESLMKILTYWREKILKQRM
jgi:GDP-4-dehydro-6-deoxy-D-mannose reductase